MIIDLLKNQQTTIYIAFFALISGLVYFNLMSKLFHVFWKIVINLMFVLTIILIYESPYVNRAAKPIMQQAAKKADFVTEPVGKTIEIGISKFFEKKPSKMQIFGQKILDFFIYVKDISKPLVKRVLLNLVGKIEEKTIDLAASVFMFVICCIGVWLASLVIGKSFRNMLRPFASFFGFNM